MGNVRAKIHPIGPRVKPADKSQRGWSDLSSAARGYGSAWRRARDAALQRDGGLCQMCRAAGRVTLATEVDHIVNRAAGGGDGLHNLQSICAACHQAKTAVEKNANRGAIGRR